MLSGREQHSPEGFIDLAQMLLGAITRTVQFGCQTSFSTSRPGCVTFAEISTRVWS